MAQSSVGGYVGKILRVDLSSKQIYEESPGEETLRDYLGGAGLAARYLYEEIPQEVEWDDPENRIMYFAGPLSGTNLSGVGTVSIVTKGPMTNMAGSSQANGYFGAYLKFAGYDGIIVQGKATDWQYLYVHDGTAELRSAEHLVGKSTWETEDLIKQGIKRQSSVYQIGPAGENQVRFAGIIGDKGHSASHNGLGAVMGSKKLKAVVVERMRRPVNIVHQAEYTKLAKGYNDNAKMASQRMGKMGTVGGTPMFHSRGILPVKNYTTSIFPSIDKFTIDTFRGTFNATVTTCWACKIAHCRMTEVTEGPYKGFVGEEPEYEAVAAMASAIGQTDPGATVMLSNIVDRLGMDVNETGWLLGWIMECYEKGYLKKDDLDGIEMNWGDVDAVLKMLDKIAHREGCGNLFAEGVKRASEKIGGEAANCAIYTMKGASPRGHDHRARWSEMIDTCLADTGTIQAGPGFAVLPQLGEKPPQDEFDAIEVSTVVAKTNGRRIISDSLVVCDFCNGDFTLAIDLLNAVTGWNYDLQEMLDTGRRIINTLRVFNLRHGLTKELEAPSVRYGSVPVDGPAEGKSIMPHWEALRSNYYKNIGWDPETGRPLPDTLEQLGLSGMIADLQKIS
ncbi:MAG: hypothetical protein JW712_07085 [Dehalococcoidales bacterium]|nr:hypothetical protein [Dehalococcoidales bacterium]